MDYSTVLTAVAAISAALITGTTSYWAVKSKTKVEIGQSITVGFKELTDQLQQERLELTEITAAQRAEIDKLRARLRHMERHAALLERRMHHAGMVVPDFDHGE